MIAWNQILTDEQIWQLVETIRDLEAGQRTPTFSKDIFPLFEDKCAACHGAMGGWDASTYEAVMTSGDNVPSIIAGDAENSLLVQKLLNVQTQGAMMPPMKSLSEAEIQMVIDWINAGALND